MAVNNFISAFVNLFVVSIIILLLAPVVFNAEIPKNIPFYLLNVALFIAVSLTVATALGAFVKNSAKLIMFEQILFLPSIMLSGIMFPVDLLPEAVGNVGKIFPATWGFKALLATTWDFNVIFPMVIIFLVALIGVAFGLKLLKKE